MNPLKPFLSGVILLAIASPLYAQSKSLPSGKSLLQTAYSAYDKPKTMQVRMLMLMKDSAGKATKTEITATVENDSAGKMARGLLTMNGAATKPGEAAKSTEQRLLNIGEESYVIFPKEKKYAPRKRESQRFSDFFRRMIGSFLDEKTTYSVVEAKMNGMAVYQITTSVLNGTRARITIDKDSRLLRRVLILFRETETIADIKIESQQRNLPVPEETFAKPGADYTLDPEITKPAQENPASQPPPPAAER
ncbi:MAG: hypothetical protein H8F28_02050 [Fibrella sp.]|nr:hypothetical protein [Armatimonadota bacterium]